MLSVSFQSIFMDRREWICPLSASHPSGATLWPNRLISISTIVQLLASSPICRRPLRPRYKGLSELRTCCWSARLPGSPRNLPRAPPRAPAPAPPPHAALLLSPARPRGRCSGGSLAPRRVPAAVPGARLSAPLPPSLLPQAALSFRPRPVLLEIIIAFAVKNNHQTKTGEVTPGFLPNKRSPSLAAADASGRSTLGVLLALSPPHLPPPQVGDFAKRLQSLGWGLRSFNCRV
ncbi:uncharacterized protein LOC106504315 [Sus scrofa]|uniref:uncharacterized protein LOC106504315 n=1 Tax=Sus scrofa TaxID=9823 RepID=UPI000A2B22E2|nr:uncharacterized protein LOC106504315 [Sus scrofa]